MYYSAIIVSRGYGWSDKPAKTSLYKISYLAQDVQEIVSTHETNFLHYVLFSGVSVWHDSILAAFSLYENFLNMCIFLSNLLVFQSQRIGNFNVMFLLLGWSTGLHFVYSSWTWLGRFYIMVIFVVFFPKFCLKIFTAHLKLTFRFLHYTTWRTACYFTWFLTMIWRHSVRGSNVNADIAVRILHKYSS